MKNRFHVVDVTEKPNLTLTRQQQDMRNRGFVFAVIDGSDGTVVSLYKTQARVEAIADLHNERDSNQKWLGENWACTETRWSGCGREPRDCTILGR